MKAVVPIFILSFFIGFVTLQEVVTIIPTNASLEYINDKYVRNGNIFISSYGQKGRRYLNIVGCIRHTWDDNVTINMVLFEKKRNEYRRTFVEFNFRLCQMLKSDPYIGAMVAKAGIKCPVPPKKYSMLNMSIPETGDYKYITVFTNVMTRLTFSLTSSGETMARCNIYLTFKKNKKTNRH